MRKIAIFIALVVLLASLAPAVYAAGYGSLSGPSTVRAGDTITLSYSIGGGVYGANGTMSYDTSQLTLQGYNSTTPGGWQGSFNGNTFLFYDDTLANPVGGATIFTATFTVNENLAPGTTVSVSVSGTVSDGNQDSGAGGSWSATIAPPLSKNCDLASMNVTGAAISPAFSAEVTGYSASVPFATASVQVTAKAADEKAKVTISNPPLAAGGTTAISITVTAENGDTKTYTIRIAREQDPNYIPSNNSKLENLTVEGQTLSPAFSAEIAQYYIWLPYECQAVSVSGKAADGKASVTIGEMPVLEPGKAVDIPVTVTAEDKSTTVYTVTIFRAPTHAETDSFLQGVRPPQPTPTEPTESTPMATEPAPAPTTTETTGESWIWTVVVGIAALVAGAAIGYFVCSAISKRRKDSYDENHSV